MLNLKSDEVKKWLAIGSSNKAERYAHLLLVERKTDRATTVAALAPIIRAAHADAKEHLRRCTGADLDPLAAQSAPSIAEAYPNMLHTITKKAYFGEIMAGLVAENFATLGPGNWRVPAFLFRLHELAFNQLELWRQTGALPQHVPGQSGDDCLAFNMDQTGRIAAVLVCESKCTKDHDSSLIAEGHEKLSGGLPRPVSLSRIASILRDYSSDPEAAEWTAALFQLYLREPRQDFRRFDLMVYTCGQRPIRTSTWIETSKPHPRYKGGRELAAVEIQISDVDGLVEMIYK